MMCILENLEMGYAKLNADSKRKQKKSRQFL